MTRPAESTDYTIVQAWQLAGPRFPKGRRGAVWPGVARLLHVSVDSEAFIGKLRLDVWGVGHDAAGFRVLAAEQKSDGVTRDRSSSSMAAATTAMITTPRLSGLHKRGC